MLPNVVPKTLSLSALNHCDNKTDEGEADSPKIEFNLKKIDHFVDDTERAKVVEEPVRSVFTNVRERFQAMDENRAIAIEEERDPFEFVDEAIGLPLVEIRGIRAAKRKRGDVGEPGGKRKKRNKLSESIGKLDMKRVQMGGEKGYVFVRDRQRQIDRQKTLFKFGIPINIQIAFHDSREKQITIM